MNPFTNVRYQSVGMVPLLQRHCFAYPLRLGLKKTEINAKYMWPPNESMSFPRPAMVEVF